MTQRRPRRRLRGLRLGGGRRGRLASRRTGRLPLGGLLVAAGAVVGDVEARAFKKDVHVTADEPLDGLLARGALGEGSFGNPLLDLKYATLLTTVLVGGHPLRFLPRHGGSR